MVDLKFSEYRREKINRLAKRHALMVAERSEWHCVYCGLEIEKLGQKTGNGRVVSLANGEPVLCCTKCVGLQSYLYVDDWRSILTLRSMGAPAKLWRSKEMRGWVDKNCGGLPRAKFWYETHPLHPLTAPPPLLGPARNSVLGMVKEGYTPRMIADLLDLSRQRVYQILAELKA